VIGVIQDVTTERNWKRRTINWQISLITQKMLYQQGPYRYHPQLEQGAEQIYGYSANETLGKSITLLFANSSEEIEKILQKIKLGEHIQHYEAQRTTKEGVDLCIIDHLADS
jgi:CRISPR/Cas system-associated protein Cas5 (RAMP superfamily)